jgi:hypothetical protein
VKKSNVNYAELEDIVCRYAKRYNINILNDRFTTSVGRAWIESREIKIPVIDSVEDFLVCLHEVGHIVTGQKIDSTTPDYMFEYLADKWAIDTAMKHGIYNFKYEMRAKWYVLSFIADYHNKNEEYSIPNKVLKFVGEDISTWKGYNVAISFTNNQVVITKKLKSIKGFK